MLTRRNFLDWSLAGAGTAFFSADPKRPRRASSSRKGSGRDPVLVVIFQRGGMDGLMAVSPLNDPNLGKLRPQLAMDGSNHRGEQRLLDLDGKLGIHPGFGDLVPLFRAKQLAVVHGVGLNLPERSHFDARDFMETATPGVKGTASGWLNRLLAQRTGSGSGFRAVSLTPELPKSFYGSQEVMVMDHLDAIAGPKGSQDRLSLYSALYDRSGNGFLKKVAGNAFESRSLLGEIQRRDFQEKEGAYPNTPLGRDLRQIALLIKGDLGMEVAFAPSDGWDTHSRQGTTRGGFARAAKELGSAMGAFWKDLGTHQNRVVVLTMTEFGRTVKQNGSGGTDHGRASCFFVLGSRVRGGKVIGEVPRLVSDHLEEGRDLPVSIDFRRVLSGLVRKHFRFRPDHRLFPGWAGKPLRLMR